MRYFLALSFVFCFVLCAHVAHAQVDVYPLANQALQQNDYKKAAQYFEELYSRSPRDGRFYDGYLKSLIGLQDWKHAEKTVRRQIKLLPDEVALRMQLADVQTKAGRKDDAHRTYDNIIDQLPANSNAVYEAANAFEQATLPDYALKAYQRGRKLLKNNNLFTMELAALYGALGDKSGMIETYLDILAQQPQQQPFIESVFAQQLTEPADLTAARVAILRRIQEFPDEPAFPQMMIWLMMQQHDYENALLQAKALDRRGGEGGYVLRLARAVAALELYDEAIPMYESILAKGPDGPQFADARRELLSVRRDKLMQPGAGTPAELSALSQDYRRYLATLNQADAAIAPTREWAALEAYALDSPAQAIAVLKTLVETPGINRRLIADAKLDLGDIYLASGEVWEPALLYGQVDKDFKEEPIGQEAKFRNARLSFYQGEFPWAQAQLDVLKTATTQLISNDAINLSLLIQDNYMVDSNLGPLQMYARADLLAFRQKPTQAFATYDSVLATYPEHPLTDEVLFAKARLHERLKHYPQAIALYDSVANQFADDILADDALMAAGLLYENRLQNKPEAMKRYERLLDKFPGSTFVVDARKRFRALRGDAL